MNIIERLISVNYSHGRSGLKVIQIVLHTAVTNQPTLFNWFNNPQARSSAHYYVNQDGKIERYVREEDTAWANTNFNSNLRSISIEHWDGNNPKDSVRTTELYNASGALVAELCVKYSIPCKLLSRIETQQYFMGVSTHNRVFSGTECPDGLDIARIISIANNILKFKIMLTPDDIELIKKTRPDIAKNLESGIFDIQNWFNETGFRDFINDKITLDGEYNKAKDDLLKNEAVIAQKQTEIQNLSVTIAELQTTQATLSGELSGVQKQVDELTGKLRETSKSLSETQVKLESELDKNVQSNKLLEETKAQIDKVNKQNTVLQDMIFKKDIFERFYLFLKLLVIKILRKS